MRLIRVTDEDSNVYTLDIDDSTSIGIDFQAYDFKEPGKRKIKISNNFSVPATANNLRIFGFPGNVHTISDRFYQKWYIDYYIDNIHLVKNSRMKLDKISLEENRIELFIFERKDIWEDMRNLLWPDMIPELLVWLRDVKGYPVRVGGSSTHEFGGSMQQFLGQYIGNTEGLTLPYYYGNLARFQEFGKTWFTEADFAFSEYWWGMISLYTYSQNPNEVTDVYYAEGGHFCIFMKTFFEFLEYKYGYNFYTSGDSFLGNIWDDTIIPKVYTPVRDISVYANDDFNVWAFFQRNDSFPGYFYPYKDAGDKVDKSVYDCVMAFMQHFNIVVDEGDNETDIKLLRFDDIVTNGTVYDWSGLASRPLFRPYVAGYGQKSYIKFASVYDGGPEYLNAKEITCGNHALDPEADLFEIDAYIPAVSAQWGAPVLDMEEALNTFEFFVNAATPQFVANRVKCWNRSNTIEEHCELNLYKATIISLDSEYAAIEAALLKPEYYELEKWLTLSDMIKFKPFNLYYFREVNGTCYINKISGFNPDKSTQPTKLEVIKLTNKAPEAVYNTNYWTDGIGDPFTDGVTDNYI